MACLPIARRYFYKCQLGRKGVLSFTTLNYQQARKRIRIDHENAANSKVRSMNLLASVLKIDLTGAN